MLTGTQATPMFLHLLRPVATWAGDLSILGDVAAGQRPAVTRGYFGAGAHRELSVDQVRCLSLIHISEPTRPY